MKKSVRIMSAVLSAVLALSLASCGKDAAKNVSENSSETTSISETTSQATGAEAESKTENAAGTTAASAKSTTTAATSAIKGSDVFEAYSTYLSTHMDYNDFTNKSSCPEYIVFDMNKDGTAELLVFDKRLGSHMERNVTVFTYNASTKSVEKIGNISVFQSGNTIAETPEKDGIVVYNYFADGFLNVIKYKYDGKNFTSEKLVDETADSTENLAEKAKESTNLLGVELKSVIEEKDFVNLKAALVK